MSQVLDACIHQPESSVICVSPLPRELMFYDSNEYKIFEKFGKIRFVGLDERKNDGPVIGFIEFESEDSSVAEQLISKGYLEIEDKRIQVKSYAEFKRRFRHISATVLENPISIDQLLQPPEPDSPTNILNVLIDDCLLEIFKKLHFSTFNSVANVCVRFNRIAKEAFCSKYQSKQINLLGLELNRQPTISTVEEFLCNFGVSISSLSTIKIGPCYGEISSEDTDTQLKLINKYCKNLDQLEFNFNSNVTDRTFHEALGLFKRLKKLRIVNSINRTLFHLIAHCSELEMLEIDQYHFLSNIALPKYACPKLIEVQFSHFSTNHQIHSYLANDDRILKVISRFLRLNTQLKIVKNDRDLRQFITILDRFNGLNEFKLQIDCQNILPHLIDTLNSHNLKLTNLNVDLIGFRYDINTVNIISQFRNITALKLGTRGINKDNLIYLLKKMPNIETIHFCECFNRQKVSNREDFDDIDKSKTIVIQTIVQNANRLKSLKIELGTYNKRNRLRQYPIDVTDYYAILKTVKNRKNHFKLAVQLIIPTKLKKGDTFQSQSIRIFNMIPELLSIELRTIG